MIAEVANPPTFTADALCTQVGPEPFHVPDGMSWDSSAGRAHAEAAKAICRECPVRTKCLEWALAVGDKDAILGGTTPHERDLLARRLRRNPDADLHEPRHMPPRRRTEERTNHILRLLADGVDAHTIATTVGVDIRTVYRVRREHRESA